MLLRLSRGDLRQRLRLILPGVPLLVAWFKQCLESMRLMIIHFKEILMGDNTGRLAEIKWGDYDVLQGVPKSISSLFA